MSSWYPPGGPYPVGPYPAIAGPRPWRRPAGPGKALRVLVLLAGIALALQGLAAFVRNRTYDDFLGGATEFERLDNADAFLGLTTLTAAGLMVAVFVLIIVWEWRLAKNHELLGRPGTTFGPGWAIGAWFIPLANFVLPYLQFRDLWKGAAPGLVPNDPAWKRVKVAPVVSVWWFTFVASYVVEWINTVSYALDNETDFYDEPAIAGTLVALLLRIVSAGALFVVAGQLTDRQHLAVAEAEQRAPALPMTPYAPTPYAPTTPYPAAPASATVAVPPGWGPVPLAPPNDLGAGWKVDPTGRASYRYWDGSRWTQHAATGGQPFVDPI